MSEALTGWIKKEAINSGFHAVGITRPDALPELPSQLQDYLARNYHGEMSWMADRAHWRADPSKLWGDCRSIIMLAESYPAPEEQAPKTSGEISAYARGRDYHDVVKKRLKKLGRALIDHAGGEIKVFVDTAPVMEKPLAEAAGIGWAGRHGNLLSRELGNWFFLGAIFTTLKLIPDQPASNHCGTCRTCVDACPTQAFDKDGHLDARRCISYLTIEHSGHIPEEFRAAMGNLIYGCDICLNACPWNKFSAPEFDAKLQHREENIAPPLAELLAFDDASFRARFSGSAIKRIGWAKMMRNSLIAAGNSDDQSLIPLIEAFLEMDDAILNEAANWALRKLRHEETFNE